MIVGKRGGVDALQPIGGQIDALQLAQRGERVAGDFDQSIVGDVELLQLVKLGERMQVREGVATEIERLQNIGFFR